MAQCAEIAGADFFCSTCDAAKTGGADAIGRRGSGRRIRRCSARKTHRSSGRRPKPSCPERGQQRNVDPSRKRAAASSTCTSPPEPPAPAIAHIDHTFALLMIMFAALAIAGPALHFVERRRRREAVNFRPPPWARVVALNTPTPRIRADAAAARRETARAYANQAARSDRKVGACTATTRGSPADSRPA